MEELDAIYAWMRARGVLYLRKGDIELRLGPEPTPQAEAEPEMTPAQRERLALETLLHSSGADITPFLSMQAPPVKT